MPIDRDGNITAVPTGAGRYSARYMVEVEYRAPNDAEALAIHGMGMALIGVFANELEGYTDQYGESSIAIAYAKNPQPLPEGQAEEGGSVSGAG